MKRWLKFFAGIVAAMVVVIGCYLFLAQDTSVRDQARDRGDRVNNEDQGVLDVAFIRDGNPYVSLGRVAKMVGYRVYRKSGTRAIQIGGKGLEVQIDTASQKAYDGKRKFSLPEPVVIHGESEYISPQSIEDLFGFQTRIDLRRRTVTLRKNRVTRVRDPEMQNQARPIATKVPLPDIDQQKLLEYAARFKGVDYQFGAEYPDDRHFDCSSFTQYVFRRFGVDLPRTARAQATEGVAVSPDSLQPGDLLFFFIPGRFKNNDIPGHVGIYWGQRKMIHTMEEGVGVTIESLDKEKFQKTFLTARRVAQ